MSKTRLISALAAGLCILIAAGWFAASTFPLSAAPQVVADAPGVTVDTSGAVLLHRNGVPYPEAARKMGVQGMVTVEVRLDNSGNVADAHVLSGPDELRKSTLQSVLQWHFGKESAGMTRQVAVSFTLPAAGEQRTVSTINEAREKALAEAAMQNKIQQRNSLEGRTVRSITVSGLSQSLRDELTSKLQLHVGDTITKHVMERATKTAKEFDEHLTVFAMPVGANEAMVQIIAPGSAPAATSAPERIKIGGNVQAAKLIQQPHPVYPPEAKAQRVQGTVRLAVVIAKDGTMKEISEVSGDPLLVPSAIEAVRQWVYQPTLLNGEPVEVQTMIDVNYTLSQ